MLVLRHRNVMFAALAAAVILALPLVAAADEVSDLKKKILASLRKAEYGAVMAHAQALSEVGGEKAADTLFEIGLKVDVPRIFNGIGDLLAKMTGDEELAFFEKQSKKGPDAAQIYLSDILAKMKHERAGEFLGNLADSKSPHVLSSTVTALAKQRNRQAVGVLLALVERLEKSKDRGLVYQEARDTLFDLTGYDFDTLEDWQKWWDPVKDSWTPDQKKDGPTTVRESRDDAPEFVGRKIFADTVVFVIDTSGTMRFVQKHDIPGLGTSGGSDAIGPVSRPDEPLTEENARLAKWWTRIEMAKRELSKALGGFGAQARVNVVEFHKKVSRFQKKMVQASSKTKKDFLLRVKKMEISQIPGTDTLGALKEAFASDARLAAIYFLSDGLPSADGQKNDDPLPLLDEVEALNRFRKVKIHTFGYDPYSVKFKQDNPELKRANEFLQKLAERTGGTFTMLKVTDEKPPEDFK